MTEPLTVQDIEEMERVAEKATAEPWDEYEPCKTPDGNGWVSCGPDVYPDADGKSSGFAQASANCDFIARSRSFVPRAISDLRRLREEVARLARELTIIRDGAAEMKPDLTAAIERAEKAERERDAAIADTQERIAAWLIDRLHELRDRGRQISGAHVELLAGSISAGAWSKEQP